MALGAGCTLPTATATFNCTTNKIDVSVTNVGSGGYTLTVEGTALSATITTTGTYSLGPLATTQTYTVIAADGSGCEGFINFIYPDCYTPAGGCSDIINDGGFEQAANTTWTDVTTCGTAEIVDPLLPLAGAQSAWLGGWGQACTTSIEQSVTIPSGNTVTLYFWLLLGVCDSANDVFTVSVDGTTVYTKTASGTDCGGEWKRYSVNLSSYANGAAHTIKFQAVEVATNGTHSNFFLDEVTLESCGTPPTYDCPALNLNIGDPCDDGNANTTGDVVNANCVCQGTFGGNCPSDYTLINTETGTADYETDGNIISISIIESGATVDYDAGTYVDMLSGFWAKAGCNLQAFIDGCNGSGGILMPKPEPDVAAKSLGTQSSDAAMGGTPNFHKSSKMTAVKGIKAKKMAAKNTAANALNNKATLVASPNPSHESSNIIFSIPTDDEVSIEMYDIQGRLVKTVFKGWLSGNVENNIVLPTQQLQAGVYILRLHSNQSQKTLRLIVE
ncbi:MAG: T9SS type A sorting domain-containing protein [Sphingobacteriales bacterium]|nr:T9SS type A sorting domain-containing protein [Sphingobacteriales bacterium]